MLSFPLSVGGCASAGGGGGGKARKVNFTAREVEVLLAAVRSHRDTVLFGVAGGRGWSSAWVSIANIVSRAEGIHRSESDVRKKWTYLKWEAKNTSKPGRDPTSRAVLDILTSHDDEVAGAMNARALLQELVPQTSHGSPAPKPPHQPPQQQAAAPPPQHLPRRPEMKPLAPKPPPRPATPPPPPEVCLRWNSYHSNMQATFPNLLNNEQFVDVTLACEGRSIKCHKVMLSACSSYFDELLTQNPCQHPIVLMKDLRFWEIQALVDFMYCGEVNVGQDKLPSLLAAAEALQIKGLAGPASTPSLADDDEDDDSLPPHVAYDGGGGDHVKRDAAPSPAQSRRARKRRCPAPQPPPPPQVVHHAQPPPSGRSTRLLQRSSTVTSGSAQPSPPPAAAPGPRRSQQQPAAPSEPPARRMRLELSPQKIVETLREIKLEPLDIDDDSVGDCDHLRPSDLADDFADHDGANDDDANNDDTNNGTNDTNSEHGNSSEERPDNHDPGEADATLSASTARRSSPTAPPGASGGDGSKLDEDD